jgi:hypothetical protein
MNPTEHFWTFLKSEWKDMKRGFENQRRYDEQRPLRKPFTPPYTEAEMVELRALLGEQDDERAAAASQPGVAMGRVSTTPSTGSVDEPTPGTGFDTLTPAEIEAQKYRRGGS